MRLPPAKSCISLLAALLAPAVFGWAPAAVDTFKDIPGKPHTFVLVVDGPAEVLTQKMIVQLRDYITVWAAPTGWKLAAKGQKGAYVVQMPVTSKKATNPAGARAVIWSNYAYIDNGKDSDIADDDDYPMDDEFVGYPFGYWDYSFWDFYDTAPFNFYGPSRRHAHRPSPLCPEKGAHPTNVYVAASYTPRVTPRAFRLPAPSHAVVAIVRSISPGGSWGSRGFSSSKSGFVSRSNGGGNSGSGGRSGGDGGGSHSSGGGASGGGGGFSGGGGGVSTTSSTTSK
jgi:hypothetical protein